MESIGSSCIGFAACGSASCPVPIGYKVVRSEHTYFYSQLPVRTTCLKSERKLLLPHCFCPSAWFCINCKISILQSPSATPRGCQMISLLIGRSFVDTINKSVCGPRIGRSGADVNLRRTFANAVLCCVVHWRIRNCARV